MSSTHQISIIDHLPTREGYDRWAAVYDEEQNPLVMLEHPHVDALLGPITPGLRIADIGCGTGRHAIRLAMQGAEVVALDFSREMLNRAQTKLANLAPGALAGDAPQLQWWGVGTGGRVRFVQHDLAHPLPIESHSFDRVLCSLVLDHIPDLAFLFAEMKRICKPHSQGGVIVVSNMHPALMLRGVQARFTDPLTGRETRPASCPHQISDYLMAAISVGLIIDHLSEHAVDDDLAKRCPRAEKYLGWPLLLMIRLRPE
jgi:ubiquinone/menaquinone biosynthesis C-methylase UbiE